MKKLLPLIWAAGLSLLLTLQSFAQTYPSPTFKNVTVQGTLTTGTAPPCVNIGSFGGLGDGTTANDTAMTNALASLSTTGPITGGCIYFPHGKYKFAAAVSYAIPGTSYGSITIRGDGSENTILYWPAGNGLSLIPSNFRQTAHLERLTLSTGVIGFGTALTLTTPTFSFSDPMNTVSDVFIRGDDGGAQGAGTKYWGVGLHIHAVNNVAMDRLTINGGVLSPGVPGTGVGIQIEGDVTYPTNQYAFNYYLSNSELSGLGAGVTLGDYTQGLFVTNTAFAGVAGISNVGVNGSLCCINVSNSQFNNSTLAITNNTAATYFDYTVANSLFFINQGAGGILEPHDGGGMITGNTFDTQGVITTGFAINLQATASGVGTVITGNRFKDLPDGIELSSTTSHTVVSDNILTNVTRPITALGVVNLVANNLGYNPVGNSTGAYPLATGATYTAGFSRETHYLTSATAFSVALGGIGTICNNVTSCQVQLAPGAIMSITYSVAPTDGKSIH